MKISILLQALTARFETDVARARKRLDREMKQMKRDAERVGRRIGLAIAGAAVATTAIVRVQARYIDQLNDTAQVLGVNIETLQELRFAAERYGIANQGLEDSLRRLNRRAGEFANSGGGPAAKAFEYLGVSVTDAAGRMKSSEQLFIDITEALQDVENDAQKSALAAQLFGDDFGPKLVPLLNAGTAGLEALREEFRELNVTVTQAQAEAIGLMNDRMGDLRLLASGVARRFTAELAPSVAAIAELMIEAAKETDGFEQETRSAADGVLQSVAFVIDAVDLIPRAFESAANGAIIRFEQIKQAGLRAAPLIAGAFGQGWLLPNIEQELRLSQGIIDEAKAELEGIWEGTAPSAELFERVARIRAEMAKAAKDLENRTGSAAGGIVKVIGDDEKEKVNKVAERIRELVQEVQGYGGTAEDKALLQLVSLGATEDELMRARQVLDELRILREEEQEREDAAQRRNELESEYASIVQSLRTPIEQHADAVQRVVELYAAGIIKNVEEYEKILERMNQRFLDSQNETEKLDQYAVSAARNMQSAFADFLFDPLDEGFKGMVDSFSAAIRRMAAEAAAAQILQALGNSFGGGDGGNGGFWASFFSSFGEGRARGGPVSANQPYLVGEKGPEIVVPRVSGTVIPNNRIGAGGSIHNTFIIPPTGHRLSESQLAKEMNDRQQVAAARNR